MVGHIKLDRKILSWEWYQDANTCRLFIHLLLTANHKEGRWQGSVIGRGQLITGGDKLAHALKLNRQQIRTSLFKLQTTNEITIKSTNRYSMITICKYDTYQSSKNESNQPNNQPDFENQPTSNQPVTTNNNNKNNKEEIISAEKHFENMLIQEMMKIWKQHNPSYVEDDEIDYPACLQLAYKIAALKKWKSQDVLNGKMQDTLNSWDKIVAFLKSDSFYRKLSIEMICKKWQGVVQSMEAKRKELEDNPAKPEKEIKSNYVTDDDLAKYRKNPKNV